MNQLPYCILGQITWFACRSSARALLTFPFFSPHFVIRGVIDGIFIPGRTLHIRLSPHVCTVHPSLFSPLNSETQDLRTLS